VKQELIVNKKTVFLFGAYGIGKERMYMSVAKALNCKVYVDNYRMETMMCYHDWPPEDRNRLTSNSSETQIWVKDMSDIKFQSMEQLRIELMKKSEKNIPFVQKSINALLALRNSSEQPRIVGFSPTGWSHKGSSFSSRDSASTIFTSQSESICFKPLEDNFKNIITSRHKDGNSIHSVPYSEHSSFAELVDFIRTFRYFGSFIIPFCFLTFLFRPKKVIPTVNCSEAKLQLRTLYTAADVQFVS
jgi:DNA cross-link repair 1A protein